MTSPAMASRPVIRLAQASDPGRDPSKQVNEDACAYREVRLGQLLVVCDGMGGHAAGREASNLAVQTILAMVEGAPDGLPPGQVLKSAIEQAGRAVYQLGGAGAQAMRPGSTVVALLMHPLGTEVAHVGDSRAYCIREGQIYPLTRDHSMVQQMVDAGLLAPEEAYGHPDSNKITRALGLRAETDVELRPEPVLQQANDIFLLATDGLFDVARAEEALDVVLGARALEDACDKLVDLANERGGPDNITVMLARVVEPGLRALPAAMTQIADASSLSPFLDEEEPGRTTLLQTPATTEPTPATLKETLPIGTLKTDYAGGATLLENAPPPFPRSSSPLPTQLDPSGDEESKPSHRGGLYLGIGIAAVWAIIFAVSLWWLLGKPKTQADPPPEIALPVPSAPVPTPQPESPEPGAEPVVQPNPWHSHGAKHEHSKGKPGSWHGTPGEPKPNPAVPAPSGLPSPPTAPPSP